MLAIGDVDGPDGDELAESEFVLHVGIPEADLFVS
jgi:hypothetical protein